jgi:hypothetical protein
MITPMNNGQYPSERNPNPTQQLKEWIAIVEAESGEKVGIFQVDLGTEFDMAGFIRYLREHGIRKETSAPYSSVVIRTAVSVSKDMGFEFDYVRPLEGKV